MFACDRLTFVCDRLTFVCDRLMFVCDSLELVCAALSLRLYVLTTLRLYVLTTLRLYVSTTLRLYVSTTLRLTCQDSSPHYFTLVLSIHPIDTTVHTSNTQNTSNTQMYTVPSMYQIDIYYLCIRQTYTVPSPHCLHSGCIIATTPRDREIERQRGRQKDGEIEIEIERQRGRQNDGEKERQRDRETASPGSIMSDYRKHVMQQRINVYCAIRPATRGGGREQTLSKNR